MLLFFVLMANNNAKNLLAITKDLYDLKVPISKINTLISNDILDLQDIIPTLKKLDTKDLIPICTEIFNMNHLLPHKKFLIDRMQYYCIYKHLETVPDAPLTDTDKTFFELIISSTITHNSERIYNLLLKSKEKNELFLYLSEITDEIVDNLNIVFEMPSDDPIPISHTVKQIKSDPMRFKDLIKNEEFSPHDLLELANTYVVIDPKTSLKLLSKLPQNHETTFLYIIANYFTKNFRKIKKLTKKIEKLSPRNRFWVAYTLQTKNQKVAIPIYQELITKYPLSFYAILSLGQLVELNQSFTYDITNYESLNDTNLTKEIEDTVTRLKIWATLEHEGLMMAEFNYLKDRNKNPDLYIQILDFLESKKAYLASFKLIYDLLDENILTLNKPILEKLFPFEFTKEINKNNFNLPLVLSIIRQESAFNPNAVSKADARGAMQILPKTARTIKKIKASKLLDPGTNISIGATYLDRLLSSTNQNIIKALMAYNAGLRNVRRWENNNLFDLNDFFAIELTPFNETKTYVKLIIRNFFFYSLLSNDYDLNDAILTVNNHFFKNLE